LFIFALCLISFFSGTTSQTTCPQAQCTSGVCISYSQLGDSICDCLDGSDEASGFCTPGSTCPQKTCENSTQCYNLSQLDDSVCDCPLGDDEPSHFVNCTNASTPPTAAAPTSEPNTTAAPTSASTCPEFTCTSGQCIEYTKVGDGNCDCTDGTDETLGYCTPGSSCKQKTCGNKVGNVCYGDTQIDDGVCDCPAPDNGEDEPTSGTVCPAATPHKKRGGLFF